MTFRVPFKLNVMFRDQTPDHMMEDECYGRIQAFFWGEGKKKFISLLSGIEPGSLRL